MEQQKPLILSAPWSEVKEKIKEVEVSLSDADLDYSPGKENLLLERLAQKLGRTPESIRAWIESVSVNKGKAS